MEQDLIDAVDAVRRQFKLNRTQYVRRALRSAVYGDAILLTARELPSSTVRFLLEKLAKESRRRKRSRANRGRFSPADQLKGVRAALQSDRTPVQLKPSLRKRVVQLEEALEDKDE